MNYTCNGIILETIRKMIPIIKVGIFEIPSKLKKKCFNCVKESKSK